MTTSSGGRIYSRAFHVGDGRAAVTWGVDNGNRLGSEEGETPSGIYYVLRKNNI